MGSCFGHCIGSRSRRSQRTHRTKYYRQAENVEFDFLVDDEISYQEPKPRQGISYLLSFKKKKRSHRDVLLEMSDSNAMRQATQFQPLDARSLLARGRLREFSSPTSTPASSLDLEWEHEGCMATPRHYTAPATEDESTRGRTSRSWSRMSSPESLEWDPVEAVVDTSTVDMETERLLTEIERLTRRALRETGDGTS